MNANTNSTNNSIVTSSINTNSNANNRNMNIVKKDTSMNINTIARTARRAASLLAFGGLLALSYTAKADIVVDKFVGPQQTYGVAPGTTAMQLKVRNTDGYTVSGAKINTNLYLMLGFANFRLASPSSSPFSLAPYESKWITVAIPPKSDSGYPLQGMRLTAVAQLGSHSYSLSFHNVPAQANVQAGNIQMTGQNNGADVFTVTFTNNGYVTSSAQTATVSTWLYGDGQIGSADNQTVNVPALAVGASCTVTLTSQATQGYDIQGTVQIGSGSAVNFEF